MIRTIRWGIIGVGDVTEVKSGPGFQKATNSELVAVMRRDAGKVRDYAERHHVPRWYDDATALIRDPDVDAVYIATRPHVHKEYTLMVAAAGKPVLVEKPMALNHAECQTMLEACRAAGVPLWVAYYRRTLPRFVKIKELIESGAIGAVRSVAITLHRPPIAVADALPWRVQPDISGGGLFVDVAVHTLDFLDYVLGPIQAAKGYATNQSAVYPAEDNVVAAFVFASGVTGVGSWHFTSPHAFDQTIITGTTGQLAFSSFDTTPLSLINEQGEQFFPIDNPPHVHQPLIQTIVDELNGAGMCPSTGTSAARTTWVCDQLLQS